MPDDSRDDAGHRPLPGRGGVRYVELTHRAFTRRYVITRVGFGIIWGIDAVLKWLPGFRANLVPTVGEVAKDQPGWLAWWFTGWLDILNTAPGVMAVLIAEAETAVALGLIFGILQRLTFGAGIVFALAIWSVGEGFGGPYTTGATDIGAAIMYAVIFAGLWLAVPAPIRADAPALDHHIVRHLPGLVALTFGRTPPKPGPDPPRPTPTTDRLG